MQKSDILFILKALFFFFLSFLNRKKFIRHVIIDFQRFQLIISTHCQIGTISTRWTCQEFQPSQNSESANYICRMWANFPQMNFASFLLSLPTLCIKWQKAMLSLLNWSLLKVLNKITTYLYHWNYSVIISFRGFIIY